jgi:hypothetical protein
VERKSKTRPAYLKATMRTEGALAMFYNVKDVSSKEKALRSVITKWLKLLEK